MRWGKEPESEVRSVAERDRTLDLPIKLQPQTPRCRPRGLRPARVTASVKAEELSGSVVDDIDVHADVDSSPQQLLAHEIFDRVLTCVDEP